MNRKQRVKMIVRVLLSPFTRDPFSDQDLLLNYTLACQRLWAHQGLYRDLARGCAQARKALIHSLTEEVKPDRLSELRELFEMFYPPANWRSTWSEPTATDWRNTISKRYFAFPPS